MKIKPLLNGYALGLRSRFKHKNRRISAHAFPPFAFKKKSYALYANSCNKGISKYEVNPYLYNKLRLESLHLLFAYTFVYEHIPGIQDLKIVNILISFVIFSFLNS